MNQNGIVELLRVHSTSVDPIILAAVAQNKTYPDIADILLETSQIGDIDKLLLARALSMYGMQLGIRRRNRRTHKEVAAESYERGIADGSAPPAESTGPTTEDAQVEAVQLELGLSKAGFFLRYIKSVVDSELEIDVKVETVLALVHELENQRNNGC